MCVVLKGKGFVRNSYSWFSPRASHKIHGQEDPPLVQGGVTRSIAEVSPWLEGIIFCEARAVVLV